jgi:glycosyltransferase involved in cell wall biosynthesis
MPGPRKAGVSVSVVVPFRNAAPHLRDQLEALASQEFQGNFEVIAVDNASRDGSRRIVESFLPHMNLEIVDAHERSGAGYARNVGARRASGQNLIFVDADDQVAPGYIAAMAAALEVHDFVTSAFDHRALNSDWVQDAHGPVWRDPEDPIPPLFGLLPFAGGSVGVSRETFEAVGGYPEDLRYAQDIAFSWNVQLAGTPLHYVPEAVYRVRYRASLPALYRQALRWGSALPLLYRRYRNAGMRRRPAKHVIRMWSRVARDLVRTRTRRDLALETVRFALLFGRVIGSIRHRVLFL